MYSSVDNGFLEIPKVIISENGTINDVVIDMKGKLAFTFQFSKDVIITIFRGGNALIRGLTSKESALILWEELKENKL